MEGTPEAESLPASMYVKRKLILQRGNGCSLKITFEFLPLYKTTEKRNGGRTEANTLHSAR